jgi:hypothetical protein
MYDSFNVICLAKNLVFHGRAKHIKVRCHFFRDHVEKGDIVIKYIYIERQLGFFVGELGLYHPYGLV